jgi:hypothetical protein
MTGAISGNRLAVPPVMSHSDCVTGARLARSWPAWGFVLFWLVSAAPASGGAHGELPLPVSRWRVVKRESGPVNYYTVVQDPALPYIHAEYRPPYQTMVLGYPLPEADRSIASRLRWQWRAVTLPAGGNECAVGKGDSAAVLYVSWRRGLRWYTIKYVWSAVGPKGAVCDRKRNPFVAQDTVILESGGPLKSWKTEEIDLKSEFRKHFADGDPKADVPALLGIGLMTDGDQTKSESAADYASFVVVR